MQSSLSRSYLLYPITVETLTSISLPLYILISNNLINLHVFSSATMSARAQTRSLTRKSTSQPSQLPPPTTAIKSTMPSRSRKIRKLYSSLNEKSLSDQEIPNRDEEALILTKPEETLILTQSTSVVKLTTLTRPLSTEGEIECSILHLRNSDPLICSLIDAFAPPSFESAASGPRPFQALIKSIIYQQISTKVGNCIFNRFISLFETENNVSFENVLSMSAEKLREIGISGRKASYMHDLARRYEDGSLSDEMILEMDDEKMLEKLMLVKGIGPWTVNMFMIFSLHRPDVLPVSDLGVRKGVKMLYKLNGLPDVRMMENICEKWKPYRSVGSWYMWRFVEAQGVLAPPVI